MSTWAKWQLDVFVVGSDNALWHRSFNNSVWSSWESLGGKLTASPAAVSWGNGRIDVFGRGDNGALYQKTYNNSAWSGWTSLGGQLAPTTGPTVVSRI